tara:strand:+ start:34 stop:468 length:435 start_codon:yes stop_codon:yes gene_type:complete
MLISTNSYGASMIPLDDYVNKFKGKLMNEFITSNYIYGRCSAVFLYEEVTNDPNATNKTYYEKSSSKSKEFIEHNFSLMEKLDKDIQWSGDTMLNNIILNTNLFLNNYSIDGQENFQKNGEYIKGTYIADDIKYCNKLADSLKE